uniref:Uncharacterized protein n=1 Tax=Vespula pensylvanica TaxID=30213 RepID=A0A834P4M8_VESPE|nr:hypothetical protein H0235_007311 [Vespula pensylvanica]
MDIEDSYTRRKPEYESRARFSDLRIAQLSNTGSFDHHLSTTDCVSRLTPEPKIESSHTHSYLREYSGNTHANMLIPRCSLDDEILAARGNRRSNGDSTLKSTIRDGFPLRELRASQQTDDV